mmetsp:Transcript_16190/g.44829  ORF Transcript_16190/g.44829 Transcript_16190/m.44829 type:complete len:238 (+) Transcript_16190:63-776(+)
MRNTMNSSLFSALLCWIVATASIATAFVAQPDHGSKFPTVRTSAATSQSSRLSVVWDPRNPDNDSGYVEFPTASQRAEIKKEAKKRIARKKIAYFSFSDEETNGPWSDETVQAIWNQLAQSEMMELRGICRDSLRDVYQTAKWFCEDLEDLISPSPGSDDDAEEDVSEGPEEGGVFLPVALISTKGHKALIYCPTLPADHPDKFTLRTSVGQKNVWTYRPKSPRDIRGQIIKEPKPE